jgi:oxygen-dependent protoporphyrinogen oxidase
MGAGHFRTECHNQNSVSQVLILGGGISGLATAYFLSKRGLSSTIVEAQGRLGGLIKTDVVDNCRLEAGPDSYIAAKPDVTKLAEEVPELRDQIIGTNDKARRIFVVKNGKLVAMPRDMVMMVPADLRAACESALFTPQTKHRFCQERFFKPIVRRTDISIDEFVRDHFNQEVVDYVAEPLLTGVYGGDVSRLSARSVLPLFLNYEERYGSLMRAVRRERRAEPDRGSMFLSFRGGMQALTDALVKASGETLTVHHVEALSVRRGVGRWTVETSGGQFDSPSLVIALPAHRATTIISQGLPELADRLASIPHSSAITVTLVYPRESMGAELDGFGFLVPKPERRRVAAATWVSTKFPSRITAAYVAIRAFIVDRDADVLIPQGDAEIGEEVRRDLARFMGFDIVPSFYSVHRWPRSMPQYTVGHADRYAQIKDLVEAERGLSLVGNAYEGVGIPDCVQLARRTAEHIN